MSPAYLFARSATTLAKWTPPAARHVLGSAIGVASYLGWRSKRIVTQQNMAHVMGSTISDPYVRHLAYDSWRNYGRYAADFINFPNFDMSVVEQNLHDLTQGASSWLEHIELALKPGRGVIIATAHFGNWDVAGAIAARHFPFSAVAETFADEQLNSLLQNQRREKGMSIIPMEGSARRILRVLQQNHLVAIVIDRPLTEDQGIPVSFFGRTTYVPGGPAALALKTGSAIIPGYVWYGPHDHFYICTFPPIVPRETRAVNRNLEVIRLTQCMYDALEVMVRDWPAQWYMFRQFWPG